MTMFDITTAPFSMIWSNVILKLPFSKHGDHCTVLRNIVKTLYRTPV